MISQTISHDDIIRERVPRRLFLGSLAALAAPSQLLAEPTAPIPVTAVNHMTLSVSDPARSLSWYQGLFGMPVQSRSSDRVCLRVGGGPQFMKIRAAGTNQPSMCVTSWRS